MSSIEPPTEALLPGHYWKTPFLWEPGCPEPSPATTLRFESVDAVDGWLHGAVAEVMSNSLDESDRHTVAQGGAARAADELFAIVPEYFEVPSGWWRVAVDGQGRRVGFVLPVLFRDPARSKEGRQQGTVLYIGVLPEFRGQGHVHALLAEATRIFIEAGCWRIFCDTGTSNHPMVSAFRDAGYRQRTPWQRPVA